MKDYPVYFFGCENKQGGHYWWTPDMARYFDGEKIGAPWKHIDGQHTPKGKHYEQQGHAALVHDRDWTILAFVDRSVDTRPGSNANVVAPGTHSFDEMCALAQEHFPEIWARFTFPIILVS